MDKSKSKSPIRNISPNKNYNVKNYSPNKNNNVNNDNEILSSVNITETLGKEIICGELRKLKTTGVKIFSNTNLRWVELDFKKKIFGYKNTKQDISYKEYQNLYDFVEYHPEISNEHKNKSSWKYGFYVKFKNRHYTFYAENEIEYNKWKIALIRVYNIFIKYKDINLHAFRVALEKFAKPYYEELERERLKKLEDDRKKKEVIKPPPEPKKKKVNLAEVLGVQGNNDKLKSDIYSDDLKKNIEDEIENMDVIKKINISKNFQEEIKDNKKTLKDKSNLDFNDDLNDWDFYNEKNQKINENNLINYNPVLKDQRRSLSPILRSVVKGYITSNQERYLENMNLKIDKNSLEEKNKDMINNKSTDKKKTINNKNISLVMEFANDNKGKETNFYNSNNFNQHLNNTNLIQDKNSVKNKINFQDEDEFIFLNDFKDQKEEVHKNNLTNSLNFKNKNSANKEIEKYRKNKSVNLSEDFIGEDFYGLNNKINKKHSEGKFEWDVKENFKDERILLNEIKENEEEKKLIHKKTMMNLYNKNNNEDNNFNHSKFMVTKEQLLKEINEKDRMKYHKSNTLLLNKKENFENFEFTNFQNINEEKYKRNNLNESFNKKYENNIIPTFENKNENNFNNSFINTLNNKNLLEKNNLNNTSKYPNESVNNSNNKNILKNVTTYQESPNKFVMKISKENNQIDDNLNIVNNNFNKSNKKVSLLNKYIEQKATEYINAEKNDDENYSYNTRGKNSKSESKNNNWINENIKKASNEKKQKLFEILYGKKNKSIIENKDVSFND